MYVAGDCFRSSLFFSCPALKFISHSVYLSVDLINTLFCFRSRAALSLHIWAEVDGETGAKNVTILFSYWKSAESSCKVHLFYINIESGQSIERQTAASIANESANRLNAPQR